MSVAPLRPSLLATKRAVCSAIAKTYDVIGWYAPAVLPAKLLLKDLWRLELSWDESNLIIFNKSGKPGQWNSISLVVILFPGTWARLSKRLETLLYKVFVMPLQRHMGEWCILE